ncbi:hypothetical protein [Streptomyces sp. NPDC090022]|uniref:hypothetical protein n=1 Tax=Streptomyces sp. NPDC090022 TaxID=3365920 RepID=UPI0038024916
MTQSGQGGQGGDQRHPVEPPAYADAPPAADPWGPPPAVAPAPGHALGPGHVLAPGYEGPGAPDWGHVPAPSGGDRTPLPEAATQYIPPVPAAPGPMEAATQYIPPVPAAPGPMEAATQYIPPVPAAPGPGADEAATQFIPPVTDGPFHAEEQGHTQVLPPIQETVRPHTPRGGPPRPYPGQHQQPPQHPHPHQQYAPAAGPRRQAPPPLEEPARRVSPAIIAAAVFGLALTGLGVGALLGGDVKPKSNDPVAVASVPSPTGSQPPSAAAEAPVDPARAQAVQLDKLLADSNDSRATVIDAVDDIKGCDNLDTAAKDLRDAARQREGLVTRLQELKIDKLPDHARLAAALTKAWQSSAAADKHYAAWADELAGDKKDCKDGRARSSSHANDGNKSSAEATRAKESAATLWNRIAGQYGLTKRATSQL